MKRNSPAMTPVCILMSLEEHYTISCECLTTTFTQPLGHSPAFQSRGDSKRNTLLEDRLGIRNITAEILGHIRVEVFGAPVAGQ